MQASNKDYTASLKPPDSEVKPTPTRTLSAGGRIPAAELKSMIDHILDGNCHVSPTDEYINKLFPTDEDLVDNVLTKLADAQVYHHDEGRWTDMPTRYSDSKPAEVEYYAPFVAIAQAIVRACQDEQNSNFDIVWLDRHKKAPQSNYTNAALIRPDILALLLTHKNNAEWDQLIDGDDETDEQLKHAMAWWLRVHIPVEIKPREDRDVRKHVNQLLMYMRQVLKEQVNRQFVYGLLLSDEVLSVWLLDRSGVFGTAKSFNIHEDPKKFIQVIAGCSVLPPEKMGWDITMRLCKLPLSSDPTTFDIMDPEVGTEAGELLLYDTRWAIEMPSQADKSERELFITLRALSLARTDDVPGRSTVVWAAVKASDLKKPAPHKIYVLKQSWRPNDGTSEGVFYEISKGVANVGRCYSYEDVCINGNIITTDSYIRCDLPSIDPPPVPLPPPPSLPQGRPSSAQAMSQPTTSSTSQSKKRSADALDVTESLEPHSHIIADHDSYNIFAGSQTKIYPRTFFRLVLEDFGWSVKYFLNLDELLEIFKDAISAHKNLLFNNMDSEGRKLLHRDISAGNILICPKENGKFNGCLIDLDYAKSTSSCRPSLICQYDDTKPLDWVLMGFQQSGYQVPAAFTHFFLHQSFGQVDYLDMLFQAKPALQGLGSLSVSNLGFLHDKQIPDFSSRQTSAGPRSATLPFASAEVLTTQAMFSKVSKRRALASDNHRSHIQSVRVHNAVHDIEAFFWVLNYLCITREGCTGQRRSELQHGAATEENMRLRVINYYFFSSQNIAELAHNKRTMFTRDDYNTEMQPHFHPYFEPLKPLLLQWWNILLFAHQYPLESIHDWVLQEIDDALEGLRKCIDGIPISQDSQSVEETPILKKRQDELAAFQVLVTKLTAEAGQDTTSVLSLSPHKGDKPGGPDYTEASYTDTTPVQDPPSSPTPQYKRAKRS